MMSKKNHLCYYFVKFAVFTVLAVLVLIFRDGQIQHLKPFIGALMILYGTEEMLYEILNHRLRFYHEHKTYLGLIELIFGIVLTAAPLPFDHVCIIWATWSIVRESYEIKELVTDLKTWPPKVLSGLESATIIVFSVILILNPAEHHAAIHLVLLVAELILNPAVILLDEGVLYWRERRANKDDVAE